MHGILVYMSFLKLIIQKTVNANSGSLKNDTENNYYKVITKCDRSLLQSASGITKCDVTASPNILKVSKCLSNIYKRHFEFLGVFELFIYKGLWFLYSLFHTTTYLKNRFIISWSQSLDLDTFLICALCIWFFDS